MAELTIRQKVGMWLLSSKGVAKLPSSILRSMGGLFGINGPVYQIDNPEAYVKLGYHQNEIVYSIIDFIIGKAAKLDFGVRVYQNGELKEELTSHPIIDLLKNPNPIQGKQEFFEQFYGFYLATGNSYIQAPRLDTGQNKGQTKELYVLPAQFTQVIVGDSGLEPIKGYQVVSGSVTKYKFEDVLHYKKANLWHENGEAFYGASPLRAGGRTLTKANANTDASAAMFQNLGIKGILTDASEQDPWTSTQIAEVERNFYRKFSGAKNVNKVLVTNGNVRWQDIGLSPVDMALIEDHKNNLRILSSIYKVSSRLFNDPDNSTYNNQKEARIAAYTDAILPLAQGFCDAFNIWMASAYAKEGQTLELFPRVDNVPELQANLKELAEWLGQAWWIGFQEKRAAMGYPQIEGMDEKYFIPSNFIPLDEDELNYDAAKQLTQGEE